MTWVLIIMMHVGGLGSGNSNALTSVIGFTSIKECQAAGALASDLARGTVKEIKTICVQQSKSAP